MQKNAIVKRCFLNFFIVREKGIGMVSGYHVLNGKHWQIRIDFFLG